MTTETTITKQAPARERITATLFALAWMTMQVEGVRTAFVAVKADGDTGDVIRRAAMDHGEMLDSVADRLTAIAEDLGDYCSGQDMVEPADESLLTPVFGLLHGDRRAETAGQLTLEGDTERAA